MGAVLAGCIRARLLAIALAARRRRRRREPRGVCDRVVGDDACAGRGGRRVARSVGGVCRADRCARAEGRLRLEPRRRRVERRARHRGAAARMTMPPPAHARVVIIGGGIAGVSAAYHLALRGIGDVVLLEQGRLTCGTTWHAAGLVGQTRATRNATRMSRYGIGLYAALEAETGLATGWKQCGSLNVARTPARMQLMRRQMARAGVRAT